MGVRPTPRHRIVSEAAYSCPPAHTINVTRAGALTLFGPWFEPMMPVGRVYQAPPATVPRNAPVFGYNGLKSVSNSDLVITGQAVRAKKSKSPSPSGANNGSSAGSSPSKGTTGP